MTFFNNFASYESYSSVKYKIDFLCKSKLLTDMSLFLATPHMHHVGYNKGYNVLNAISF